MKCVSVQRAGRGKIKHNNTQQPCNKYTLGKTTENTQRNLIPQRWKLEPQKVS